MLLKKSKKMKALLSILVMVLLSVSTVYAVDETATEDAFSDLLTGGSSRKWSIIHQIDSTNLCEYYPNDIYQFSNDYTFAYDTGDARTLANGEKCKKRFFYTGTWTYISDGSSNKLRLIITSVNGQNINTTIPIEVIIVSTTATDIYVNAVSTNNQIKTTHLIILN